MAKYRATRDSHGYRGRYWHSGEEITTAKGEVAPPEHSFELVKAGSKAPVKDAVSEKALLGC